MTPRQLAINQLTRILEHKQQEVAGQQRERDLASLRADAEAMPSGRDFYAELAKRTQDKRNAIIAEVKRASPSKGLLTDDFEPDAIARAYQQGGAACLSVLTDRTFFRGDNQDLKLARASCDLPVLRKDFVIDPYQVYQAKTLKADAILLIVAALEDAQLSEYNQLAIELGMSVLIEVHNHAELERALVLQPQLIGINNRDLTSFVTTLATSEQLAPLAASGGALVVAESALTTTEDLQRLNACGIYAFLIGEALISKDDRAKAVRKILGG